MRIMLRFTILASSFPLALFTLLTGGSGSQAPCIATADSTVQMAQTPWHAQARVAFTDDPAKASVRVQIVDSADSADFAVIDDADSAAQGACAANAATRFIGISATPSGAEPVIYLTDQSDADYRIYVRSRSFTAREAAALIVGAHGQRQPRLAAL